MKKARRFKMEELKSKHHGHSEATNQIPSIPPCILYNIKPLSARKDLIKWQGIFNSKGWMMQQDKSTPKAEDKEQNNNGKRARYQEKPKHKNNHKNCNTSYNKKKGS